METRAELLAQLEKIRHKRWLSNCHCPCGCKGVSERNIGKCSSCTMGVHQ